MEIDVIAQLHVEHENKWKIWKIKNTYIGQRYMAQIYNIPSRAGIKAFTINIFNDAIYICFVNDKKPDDHFIQKIKIADSNRKIILKFLKDVALENPSVVELNYYDGLPSAGSPND